MQCLELSLFSWVRFQVYSNIDIIQTKELNLASRVISGFQLVTICAFACPFTYKTLPEYFFKRLCDFFIQVIPNDIRAILDSKPATVHPISRTLVPLSTLTVMMQGFISQGTESVGYHVNWLLFSQICNLDLTGGGRVVQVLLIFKLDVIKHSFVTLNAYQKTFAFFVISYFKLHVIKH